MTNANIITWLQESLQRLFTKSPAFFRIWMIVFGALGLVAYLPSVINLFPDTHIADLLNANMTAILKGASAAGLLMSQLTTQSRPGAVTDGGVVIKSTDSTRLPFTAAKEMINAEKHDLATVKIEVIPKPDEPEGSLANMEKPSAPRDQELNNLK